VGEGFQVPKELHKGEIKEKKVIEFRFGCETPDENILGLDI
jgi:hypothetical protein